MVNKDEYKKCIMYSSIMTSAMLVTVIKTKPINSF